MNEEDRSNQEALTQVKLAYLRSWPSDYDSVRLRVQRARRVALLRTCIVGTAVASAVTLFVLAGPFTSSLLSPEPRPPAGPNLRAEVVSTISVGRQPKALDADAEDVWVTGQGNIVRVDTATEAVSAFNAAMTGIDVALGEDRVWMSGGGDGGMPQGYVQAFDRGTGDVLRTFEVPGSPYGLALDDGFVWIADAQGKVWRAPQNGPGQPSAMPIRGQPRYLDAGGGNAWVTATSPESVWQVRWNGSDDSSRVALELPPPDSGTRCPNDVVVDQSTIWVTDSCQGTVLSLDEEGDVTREITVGRQASGMTVVDGAPWVAVPESNEVVRIDSLTGELLRVDVGRQPTDVAYGAGAIWVTNSEDGTLSRIELSGRTETPRDETPKKQTKDRNCDVVEGRRDPGTVVVYLLKPDWKIPRQKDFVPVERKLGKDETGQPLRSALLELLAGPSPRERRLRCESTFDDDGHLLIGVTVKDGLATVNLAEYSQDLPGVGTTTASTIFVMQLNLTVFQFPNIESIRYELNGSCDQFFRALEGSCQIVHRQGDG